MTQLLLLLSICLTYHVTLSFTPTRSFQSPHTIISTKDLTHNNHHYHYQQAVSKLQSSSKGSNNENSNRKKIPTTSRVVAAQALIEKRTTKKKKSNNNNSAVTKLEASSEFVLMSQRDKNFARNLVSTTTRRTGQIDIILGIVCSKYPPKCGKYTGIVVSALRMGVAQILFMDVKGFAAVKETVNVLKHDKHQTPDKLIKFVNAILRRVVNEGKELLKENTSDTDNVAPWLLNEWNKSYGKETTLKMVNQMLNTQSHQHIDLSLNINHNDEEQSEIEIQKIIDEFDSSEDGTHGSITVLPNKSLRVRKGAETVVSKFPLYAEGRWWVQDISSTLPAIGLISALKSRYDDFSNVHIVDMCAAPGGKSSQLLAAGFGKVTAIEANERRCRRFRENLDRLGLQERCEVAVCPGQEWQPSNDNGDNEVAAVLVDVPCSATGTGTKRPDVLKKDTSDLESLLQIQEILANHCADNILSVGGIMVYATCSLLKSESEDQVEKLIQRGGVETLPFTPGEIPGFDSAIDENGWLRVLPGMCGGEMNFCDGFFVARLIKV